MPPNDDRSEVMCSDTTVEDVPSFIVGKSTTPTPALRPSSDMSHKVMSAALNLLQLPLFPQTKQIERFNPRSHAIGGLHRIKHKVIAIALRRLQARLIPSHWTFTMASPPVFYSNELERALKENAFAIEHSETLPTETGSDHAKAKLTLLEGKEIIVELYNGGFRVG